MSKYILIFSIFFSLFGCSSIEMEPASSLEDETQRILALGLSHEENLIEAKKLNDSHKISIVTLKLTNARDKKIQDQIDLEEAERFASLVEVSKDGLKFTGYELSESLQTAFSSEHNLQSYNLISQKNANTGVISHKLNLRVEHVASAGREYDSAKFCDKWSRCEGDKIEINLISSSASNCASSVCKYKEIIEVDLSEDFLIKSLDTGFSIRFYSKNISNKLNISKSYLMGYLSVVK